MKVIDSTYQWSQIFFSSKTFWLFNLLAWFAYVVTHSVIDSMNPNASIISYVTNISYTAILGFIFCSGIRVFVLQSNLFLHHPIKSIPLICLLALAFSSADTAIHYWNLILQMPITCSSETHPPESFLCGTVTNAFFERISVILIWSLLYIYIQAERKNITPYKPYRKDLTMAILSLFAIKFLDVSLSSIAWSRNYELPLLFYILIHLMLTIVFARAIFLVKPREFFLDSQIIPLLPTIFMLIFCLGVLDITIGNVIFRAVQYTLTGYHSDQPKILLFILLGGSDGIWRSAGDLTGPLYASCRDICIVALFLMCLRFSVFNKIQSTEKKQKIDFNHSLLFWAYNVNGWFVVSACIYFSDVFGLATFIPTLPTAFSVSFFISGVFMGSMIRSILRNHYFDEPEPAFIPFVIRFTLISCALGVSQACVIWFCNHIYIYFSLGETDPFRYAYLVTYTYHFLYVCVFCTLSFLLWVLAYEVSIYQREKVNAKLKELRLENNIKQLQLNALAGKLDPHFIFNAVNNIRYLIKKDAERSRDALLVLSDILRNPIAKSTSDKVLISEELALLRNYITLSKIQFEERLHYKEDIEPDINRALIPPMMLQILIENAIKHGISQLPDGGILHLTINQKNQHLICQLINTGSISVKPSTAGFGVGLKNISERLLLLYGKNAHFSLVESHSEVIAELTLPLEYSL